VITLTEAQTRLSVDAFIDAVFQRLADGTLTSAELDALRATNSDVFVYAPASTDLTTVATQLASAIDTDANSSYTASMKPGLQIKLSGTPVFGAPDWALTFTGEPAYSYTPTSTDTLAGVAAGLAGAINSGGVYTATADGTTILVLGATGGAAFSATLAGGGSTADMTAADAPQILVTAASPFFAEVTIGIDADSSGATNVRRAADGSGKVEVTRDQTSDAFQFVQVEMKGRVTAGETWTLLSDIPTLDGRPHLHYPRFLHDAVRRHALRHRVRARPAARRPGVRRHRAWPRHFDRQRAHHPDQGHQRPGAGGPDRPGESGQPDWPRYRGRGDRCAAAALHRYQLVDAADGDGDGHRRRGARRRRRARVPRVRGARERDPRPAQHRGRAARGRGALPQRSVPPARGDQRSAGRRHRQHRHHGQQRNAA
jgi:hypothetical protein